MKVVIEWNPVEEKGLPDTGSAWMTPFLATVGCGASGVCVLKLDWENATVRGKRVSRWRHEGRLLPSYWKVLAWAEYPASYKKEEKTECL